MWLAPEPKRNTSRKSFPYFYIIHRKEGKGGKGEERKKMLLDVKSSEEEMGGCYCYKVDCIIVYYTVYRWLTIQLRICQRQPRAVSGNGTWYIRRIRPAHFHLASVHRSENPCSIDRHIERRGKKGNKKQVSNLFRSIRFENSRLLPCNSRSNDICILNR